MQKLVMEESRNAGQALCDLRSSLPGAGAAGSHDTGKANRRKPAPKRHSWSRCVKESHLPIAVFPDHRPACAGNRMVRSRRAIGRVLGHPLGCLKCNPFLQFRENEETRGLPTFAELDRPRETRVFRQEFVQTRNRQIDNFCGCFFSDQKLFAREHLEIHRIVLVDAGYNPNRRSGIPSRAL